MWANQDPYVAAYNNQCYYIMNRKYLVLWSCWSAYLPNWDQYKAPIPALTKRPTLTYANMAMLTQGSLPVINDSEIDKWSNRLCHSLQRTLLLSRAPGETTGTFIIGVCSAFGSVVTRYTIGIQDCLSSSKGCLHDIYWTLLTHWSPGYAAIILNSNLGSTSSALFKILVYSVLNGS